MYVSVFFFGGGRGCGDTEFILRTRCSVRNWLYPGKLALLTIQFCGTTPCNVSLSFVNDRSVVLYEDCGDSEVHCEPYYRMEGSAHFRLEYRDTGLRLLLVWRLTTVTFRRKICRSLTHKLLCNSFHQIVSSKLGLLLLKYSVHFAHWVMTKLRQRSANRSAHLQDVWVEPSYISMYYEPPTPNKITLAYIRQVPGSSLGWNDRSGGCPQFFERVAKLKASTNRQRLLSRPFTHFTWRSYCLTQNYWQILYDIRWGGVVSLTLRLIYLRGGTAITLGQESG
jgi:hypothetical protein